MKGASGVMRKIKFRGKREHDGEWVYGVPIFFPDESVYLVTIGCFRLDKTIITPSTLGQYTGFKDKNGKEIYEGDVCVEDAEYGDGCFDVVWHVDDIHCGWSISPSDVWEARVIGNIHENPELLEARGQE